MSITGTLKDAGFKLEKSTLGDKPIYEGIYKCLFQAYKHAEDPNGYGLAIPADFKIVETLAGRGSASAFAEFRGFFAADDKNASSKRNGVAKLLNGFFSVGKAIDTSSDEALYAGLDSLVGSCEVYIKGFVDYKNTQQPDGTWKKDKEGDRKQGWSFLTEKNALKEAEKMKKKQGHPL